VSVKELMILIGWDNVNSYVELVNDMHRAWQKYTLVEAAFSLKQLIFLLKDFLPVTVKVITVVSLRILSHC